MTPTQTYAEAQLKLFPHAYPDQLPSFWPWKRERIYLCEDCIHAKERWIKQHAEASESVQPASATPGS
jgi:hypothetical protein